MLDVRRLVLLRELDARGSIVGVSRALGISSSAISQQLAKLEAEVGIALLELVGRNVRLTPTGQLLARRADQVVDVLEQTQSELDTRRSRVQGVVRVAALSSFALQYLPGVLRRMSQTHPDVVVEFTNVDPPEALSAVAGRRVDVAVADEYPSGPRRADTRMFRTRLMRDTISVYLPRPVTSAGELERIPWILEPAGSEARDWAERMCHEAGFTPSVPFESSDLLLHRELALAGAAAAFLPRMVLSGPTLQVGEPQHRFPWPEPSGQYLYREIYAVTRSGTSSRPAVAAFLSHLHEVAAAEG